MFEEATPPEGGSRGGVEYDVAVAYHRDGIQEELRRRAPEDWRLVYAYQSAPGWFGFSDGGHVLVFMREAVEAVPQAALSDK